MLISQRHIGQLFGKVHLLDLCCWIFLLSLLPMIPFGIELWKGRWELTIQDIIPKDVVTGETEMITILGSGFDRDTTVQIDSDSPRGNVYDKPSRLFVRLPEDILEGSHRLSIRNSRGRMITQESAFDVIWQPLIDQVVIVPIAQGQTAVIVTGNYLTASSQLKIGSFEAADYILRKTHRLEAIIPAELLVGRYRLTITNPGGAEGSWEGLLTPAESMAWHLANPQYNLPGSPVIEEVRPGRITPNVKTLIIMGEHFQEGCKVILGGALMTDVKWRGPSLLTVSLSHPLVIPASGSLDLEIVNPDGARVFLEAATVAPETVTYNIEVVLVLQFEKLDETQLALLSPDHPDVQIADSNSSKTVTILDSSDSSQHQAKSKALVEVLLPVDLVVSSGQQRLIYRGQDVFKGANILVRIPTSSALATVMSEPVLLWDSDRQ